MDDDDELHARVTDEIRGLDDAGCNWAPCEGAPSVASLVLHLLGEELAPTVRPRRELLVRLAEAPPVRDHRRARELLGQLVLTAQLYRDAKARAAGLRPYAARP